MYLFRPVPKIFSGRVNPFEFEGGEIDYTKTNCFLQFTKKKHLQVLEELKKKQQSKTNNKINQDTKRR